MFKKIWVVITVLWVGVIFFNSTRTSLESSQASNILLDITKNILGVFNISIDSSILSVLIRKGAHFFEFFVFGILFFISINNISIRKDKYEHGIVIYYNKFRLNYYCILTLCFGFAIAIIDEHIQGHVSGRVKSVNDVFIDLAGVVFAVILISIIWSKKLKSTLNNK